MLYNLLPRATAAQDKCESVAERLGIHLKRTPPPPQVGAKARSTFHAPPTPTTTAPKPAQRQVRQSWWWGGYDNLGRRRVVQKARNPEAEAAAHRDVTFLWFWRLVVTCRRTCFPKLSALAAFTHHSRIC